MATSARYNEIKKRLQQQSGSVEQSNETQRSDRYNVIKSKLQKGGFSSDVDENYINSFLNDAKAFVQQTQQDYSGLNYATATDKVMQASRASTRDDLTTRAGQIRTYLNANKGTLDSGAYSSLIAQLDDFSNFQTESNNAFRNAIAYYSQWDTEGDYNAFVSGQEEYQKKLGADPAALEQELNELKAVQSEYEELKRKVQTLAPSQSAAETQRMGQIYQQYGDLDALISEKQAYLNNVQRIQKGVQLSGVIDPKSEYYDPDFASKTGYTSTESSVIGKLFSQYGLGYDDLVYEYINGGQNGMRDKILGKNASFSADTGSKTSDNWKIYDHMTEDEISIYNYYYNQGGKEAADEYLDSIQETLNYRSAQARYGKLEGNTALELLFGAEAGLDQFSSGVKSLFSGDDYTAPSDTQILSGMVREDLKDTGPQLPEWLGGASIGQAGYDMITTTSNMVPSILVSTALGTVNPALGSAAGSTLLGASAAGNAYQEKLNQGYSKEQAGAYGLMIGVSEVVLEKVLGGISKLGGGNLTKAATQNLSKVDNVLARFAKSAGGKVLMNAGSEAVEEGLQSVIEPYLWQAVSGKEASVEWEEALYSALMGFATGGVFEGVNVAATSKGNTFQQPQSTQQYVNDLLNDIIPATKNTAQTSAPTAQQGKLDVTQLFDDAIAEAQRTSGVPVVATPAKSVPNVDKTAGRKRSKVYTNTYKNATGEAVQSIGQTAQQLDPNIADYDPITEKESFTNAVQRLRTQDDINQQYQQLVSKEGWTGEDNDTAMLVMDHLRRKGDKERFRAMARAQRAQATRGGQLSQSFAKYTRTPTNAAATAMGTLDDYGPSDVPRKFWRGKEFDAWKGEVAASILDISNRIEEVDDGNTAGMRDVVRALANFRRTTAWFGASNNLTKIAERALSKVDYETAKDIAIAQLSQIPGDFKKRSAGEIVKTIRIYNMLSSISTVNRNIVGNASIGIVDAVSDSTVGRALDALVSLWTKKRTVGNDVTHAKTYFNAAAKAAEMASLCAELDIPMGSESRFSTGPTRTFSPQGGPVARFLSAYEKGMKYALEVTDKFFEGGTRSAVEESLRNLGAKSNLTEDQISALSQKAGQRRTFKDDRTIAKATKGVKNALNEFGTENIGLGDFAIPFAGTGSNVTQTAIDYTGGGAISGLYELAKIAKDVKNGKQVDVMRQRKAVTDAARSMTGIGLIAAFAALAVKGIIGVHDDGDKDERALDQSLGLSGAQFNVDAMLRAFAGEDTAWQDGDWTVSVDFLEPFNAQMYVGYILSQEDSVADMVKAYPKASVSGVAQSVLDMPMMQSLSDTVDLASGALESFAEGNDDAFSDAAGQMLGNYGSSFIPSWVRQTAHMTDPYYRDTTGNNAMEKAANQIKSNIPGLSQTLPKKYSGLGEEQLRHEGGLSGFFNTYINPGKISRISTSDIADSLDRISETTGKKTIYPDYIAPGSFTYTDENGAKQTVTISGKEMTETYQKTYGENVAGLYSDLLSMDYFNSLDAQTQASIMESAESYATKLARASISDYSEIPEYIKKKPADMSEAEAIVRQALVGTTTLYTDIPISSAVYVHDLLDSLKDLPRETKTDGTSYTNVRPIQQMEAVVADDKLTDYVDGLLRDIMPDSLEKKYDTALNKGISADDFVEGYRQYIDTTGEGKKQSLIRYYQRELGLSYAAAQKLYEIYNPPKK